MARREEITNMLKGIERYNPENLNQLELYVDDQVARNNYDLEANLAILKLYQFNPNFYRNDVVVNILLKALTNLPHTDFTMCKCLIDPQLTEENESVRHVMELHTLLETCQFKEFWTVIHRNLDFWHHVNGFENSIRDYICHIINITYQKTTRGNLMELLGLTEEKDLVDWMKKNKWKEVSPTAIFIANQEENIKTKNITEKIDFESVAPVVAAYR